MWGTIISFVLGFAAGCGFKEIIGKQKADKSTTPKRTPTMSHPVINRTYNTRRNQVETVSVPENNNGFNLNSISYLFSEFNVQLADVNSFTNLLRTIENTTYTQTLQYFVDNATTPIALYNLLEHGSSKDIIVKPTYSSSKTILPDAIINKLLSDRKIDYTQISSAKDKVQILVSYAVTKGLKSFQQSMGNSLNEFVEKNKDNQDVDSLYREIYANIKETLNYLIN